MIGKLLSLVFSPQLYRFTQYHLLVFGPCPCQWPTRWLIYIYIYIYIHFKVVIFSVYIYISNREFIYIKMAEIFPMQIQIIKKYIPIRKHPRKTMPLDLYFSGKY